jgi:hypothetical protein
MVCNFLQKVSCKRSDEMHGSPSGALHRVYKLCLDADRTVWQCRSVEVSQKI